MEILIVVPIYLYQIHIIHTIYTYIHLHFNLGSFIQVLNISHHAAA